MRCLVVGGTGFLGGAIVQALVAAEHPVSILSRGRKPSTDLPNVEVIHADRFEDLSVLRGRSFDWIFDTCAYTPASVENLLAITAKDLSRYILISSVSAYGSFREDGLDETAPVPEPSADDFEKAINLPSDDRASAFAYGASYGPLKRACEDKSVEMLGARATALRVGLLVGAGDYTDRLTWWVRRLDEARGARRRVPVPAPVERSVQMIDVRDVAVFALRCATDNLPGLWNVTGQPLPLEDVLGKIVEVSKSGAELVPVSEEVITRAGVAPWSDMPLMAPPIPDFRYFLSIGTEKARIAGLVCRPLHETIEPLLQWDRARRDIELKCGMSEAQEARLLDTASG